MKTMMSGILMNAAGACPICGESVRKNHGWNGMTLTERYACGLCGETTYAVSRAPANT